MSTFFFRIVISPPSASKQNNSSPSIASTIAHTPLMTSSVPTLMLFLSMRAVWGKGVALSRLFFHLHKKSFVARNFNRAAPPNVECASDVEVLPRCTFPLNRFNFKPARFYGIPADIDEDTNVSRQEKGFGEGGFSNSNHASSMGGGGGFVKDFLFFFR